MSTCFFNKLGVSGKMGAGKSTVARLAWARLTSETGLPWTIRAFAGPLKSMVCAIYGIPLSLAYTEVGKRVIPPAPKDCVTHERLPYPMSDAGLRFVNRCIAEQIAHTPYPLGVLLQIVGSIFRRIDPDYWVKAFEASLEPNSYVIIEDVRFPNEVDWIRANFGVVCRVDGVPLPLKKKDGRSELHASETALDDFKDWDFVLDNTKHEEDMSRLHGDLAANLKKYISIV